MNMEHDDSQRSPRKKWVDYYTPKMSENSHDQSFSLHDGSIIYYRLDSSYAGEGYVFTAEQGGLTVQRAFEAAERLLAMKNTLEITFLYRNTFVTLFFLKEYNCTSIKLPDQATNATNEVLKEAVRRYLPQVQRYFSLHFKDDIGEIADALSQLVQADEKRTLKHDTPTEERTFDQAFRTVLLSDTAIYKTSYEHDEYFEKALTYTSTLRDMARVLQHLAGYHYKNTNEALEFILSEVVQI